MKPTAAASKRGFGIQVRENCHQRCRITTASAVAAAAAAAQHLARPPSAGCTHTRRTASGIGAGVGVGEDEMRPEAGSSLPASNSFLKVASLP